jgi:hypothetical protein
VIRRALIVAFLLAAASTAADAQIFIASEPKPGFEIGPLFIRANVTPALGPIDVDVYWSIAVPSGRSLGKVGGDIHLLWPSAVLGESKLGESEPALEKYVEARGFDAIDGGRVPYAARNLYGTTPGQWEAIAGGAPFVTYVRTSGAMGLTSPATFIRIPWDPRMLNRAFLMRLSLKTKGLLKDKPGTWTEHIFWGDRHRLTLSFNEVRARGVFPMYFEHRDRMIRLSEDPAQLLMDFSNSTRLKIDEMQPAGARRQLSETRDQTDTVSLYIDRSEGLTPQVLAVQFGYFTGFQSWAPVLIPLAFFLAGNLGGVLLRTVAERLSKRWAGRLRFWRKEEQPVQRQTGVILEPETLSRIRPGTTTYQQVLELCGHDVEERVTLAQPDRKTLIYRGRRIVPHHRRLAGLLAAVTYWDVEDHEVEIVVERDVVRDVQAHVRRSRLSSDEPVAAPR